MKFVTLVEKDMGQAVKKLSNFHENYIKRFSTTTRNMSNVAKDYMQGLVMCQKRCNIKGIEKIVPDSDSQSLNHFISNSPWKDEGILSQVSADVMKLIGDEERGFIHIDESGFEKDGDNSVGVQRQYCGRLGKVENCQVGVFLGYTNGSDRILIDRRLYLGKTWIEDKVRRKKCAIPEDVEFQTKAQLGWELLKKAEERKVLFSCIGMDCHYGEQPWLLEKIEGKGWDYIADIPCNTRAWKKLPKTEVPERKGNKGAKPRKLRVAEGEKAPIEVRKLALELEEKDFHRIFVRKTERGELWTCIAFMRVYPVRDKLPGPESWLIIRKDEGEKKTRYQLSNAAIDVPIERLAEMSHSRYWIERALQDAKGEAGLADYEVRGWMGWHHHTTMVILAMLYLLDLKLAWVDKAPILTLKDVREILEVILPKRKFNEQEVIELIKQKHKARYSARMSHLKKMERKRKKKKKRKR